MHATTKRQHDMFPSGAAWHYPGLLALDFRCFGASGLGAGRSDAYAEMERAA
jgi:hypothetical protein